MRERSGCWMNRRNQPRPGVLASAARKPVTEAAPPMSPPFALRQRLVRSHNAKAPWSFDAPPHSGRRSLATGRCLNCCRGKAEPELSSRSNRESS